MELASCGELFDLIKKVRFLALLTSVNLSIVWQAAAGRDSVLYGRNRLVELFWLLVLTS